MLRRSFLALLASAVVVAVVAVASGTGLAQPAKKKPKAVVRAQAQVLTITQPGLEGAATTLLVAPPTAEVSGPFSFPDDGSVLQVTVSDAKAQAQAGTTAGAEATVELRDVTLFAGEITIETVVSRSIAASGRAGSSASTEGSTVLGLTVLGTSIPEVTPGQVVQVGDWGELTLLAGRAGSAPKAGAGAGSGGTGTSPTPGGAGSAGGTGTSPQQVLPEAAMTAFRLVITAAHGGVPPGTEVVLGITSSKAVAEVLSPARPPKGAEPEDKPQTKPPPKPRNGPGLDPGTTIPGAPRELFQPAPEITAQLSQGGYVFPVYGPASFGDSFGAPRADVSGGWHHGEDIVGPLGTPLVAVADGTVFSVGYNQIGGWRLWLRDLRGNEFYYAHLSAYSPLAVDGTKVKAGDVLGFMGDSGDAKGGVVHLHFEIHPVELLSLGYDGVVAPYPFLIAWRRAEDVSFSAGRRYALGEAGAPGAAPPAGAILLELADISTTSGLVPGALQEAVVPRPPDIDRLVLRTG